VAATRWRRRAALPTRRHSRESNIHVSLGVLELCALTLRKYARSCAIKPQIAFKYLSITISPLVTKVQHLRGSVRVCPIFTAMAIRLEL
jgi:hypothetical protein